MPDKTTATIAFITLSWFVSLTFQKWTGTESTDLSVYMTFKKDQLFKSD